MSNTTHNPLDTYLDEIKREPLLSDDEEAQLAERIQRGDSRAVDALVGANLTFVVSVARQYTGQGLDMEDLISEGNIGMLEAATRFDGGRGKRFVAFAAPYIRRAIEAELNRVSPQRKQLSIDAPIGGSPELSLGRVIADKSSPDPDNQLATRLIADGIAPLLSQLDTRERHVMQRIYGVGVETRTMAEIAAELGIKRERVRQIRDKALRKVHRLTRNMEMKSYIRK